MKLRMWLQTAVFTVSVVVSGLLQANEQNAGWQLAHQQKGMLIHTRAVPGSDYLQVKARVDIAAARSDIKTFFSNTGECWQWQSRCSSTQILETLSDTSQRVYTTIDMPWPLSDRELVFVTNIEVDDVNRSTKLTLFPSEYPKSSNKLVRARSTIEYEIRSINAAQSVLTVLMHTDFGGDISASFINPKLVDTLRADITKLIELSTKNAR